MNFISIFLFLSPRKRSFSHGVTAIYPAKIAGLFTAVVSLLLSWRSTAAIYTVTASFNGEDLSTASQPPASPRLGYFAGSSAGDVIRDYFIFDLSGLGNGTITSATLSLYNPGLSQGDLGNGFLSPNPSETFQVGSVSTPLSTLSQGTGGASVFNDLAAGTVWGTRVVNSSDDGTYVQIPLNVSFLQAAQSQLGAGSIGMGGHLVGDTGLTQDDFIFGYSATFDGPFPQLILNVTPVPEPSTGSLLLVGLGLAGARLRSRFGKISAE